MKIQPSLERVNEKKLPAPEIDDTSSRSETRLFSGFSPANKTVDSACPEHSKMHVSTSIKAIKLCLIECDPFRPDEPAGPGDVLGTQALAHFITLQLTRKGASFARALVENHAAWDYDEGVVPGV
ncbi:MAG TPA: hypothetical protein VMZ06_07105 [Candidatus Bathyarchaeia archaeon]|nr:hypothetical protein [Candidatus Bathyarchaeia archaeon]